MNYKNLLDNFLECTVVGSYSNLGYQHRSKDFNPTDLKVNLSGKVYVVTGANSGIGFSTALGLAKMNATVVLLCRHKSRAEKAAKDIFQQLPADSKKPEIVLADLSDLEETQRAAKEILSKHSLIHGLIHNAGNANEERQVNAQGIESMFAINVLSSFLLTEMFLPTLRFTGKETDPARVIWVASGGMYTAGIDVTDLQWTKRKYSWPKVYAENKRAQVVLAEEYSKVQPLSAKVIFHSMHPGWVRTNLVHSFLPNFEKIMGKFLRTPEEGADTIIWLAACAKAIKCSGKFWLDRKKRKTVLIPGTKVSSTSRKMFWTICQDLLRVHAGSYIPYPKEKSKT